METTIQVVLTAVPTAALTALVTWFIAERRIAVKYITEERAKWRKQVRKLELKVHDAILRNQDNEKELRRLRSEFSALLNPFSSEDREILNCITVKGSRKKRKKRAKKFTRRISLLLKHDWERAKLEAGWCLPRWTLKAKRHRLGCDKGEGCRCRNANGLPWRDKYKVRPMPAALVLGIVLIVVLSIIAWLLCHCFGPSETKHTSMHVLLHAGMDDGGIHSSL